MKSWNMHDKRFGLGKTGSDMESLMEIVSSSAYDRDDFLPTTFLKLEYRVMVWLMQRGDFWSGVRMKAFRGETLTDKKFESLEDLSVFLMSSEGKDMIDEFE